MKLRYICVYIPVCLYVYACVCLHGSVFMCIHVYRHVYVWVYACGVHTQPVSYKPRHQSPEGPPVTHCSSHPSTNLQPEFSKFPQELIHSKFKEKTNEKAEW